MYEGHWVEELNDITKAYIYPYRNEGQNIVAEITIETDGTVDLNSIETEIPHLKYNKQLLVMLTQDDCMHAAFCRTWAAIHNRPVSNRFYYDYVHLLADDLPPSDLSTFNKTLGSTDGAGNEVRFSFTTTVDAESGMMDIDTRVALHSSSDVTRFNMQSRLSWRNLIEMLNYDVGIAFHDVQTEAVNDVDSIKKHYALAQNIIQKKLSGRGCKALTEPNGNKTYVDAALQYDPIQTMTAQAGATTIYPFMVDDDLRKTLQHREFWSIEDSKRMIQNQFNQPTSNRQAVHIGVHGTDYSWAAFLYWLNENYGKDAVGKDSYDIVWMPNFDEYYEYTYNRKHGKVERSINGDKLTIKVSIPGSEYFYFPSTTVNLIGLDMENVVSVSSSNSVTGLSYANIASPTEPNKNNLMLNIDCRAALVEHAERYVKQYEESKSDPLLKDDALYFVNRLKDSDKKTVLLVRLQ